MKVLPMILRLRSGSVTPLSRRRNRREASSYCSLIWKWRPNTSRTTRASRPRSRPLLTKMQVSWLPMALCSSAAATLESTPAAQAQDDLLLAHLGADCLDRLVDVIAHRPVLAAAADVVDEIGDDLPAVGRVHHFGMKLQAEHLALAVLDGGEVRILGHGHRFEAFGKLGQLVAVRVPDLESLRKVRKEGAKTVGDAQVAFAVFAFLAGLDLAAQIMGQQLHAVADAQHGDAQVEHARGRAGARPSHRRWRGRRTG